MRPAARTALRRSAIAGDLRPPRPSPTVRRRPPRRAPQAALLALLAACVGSAGCTGDATTSPPPLADALVVESPRAFAPRGSDTGAIYLTIANGTGEDDLLLAAATPVAAVAEVHETVEEDGVARMIAYPQGMPVPAGERTVLAPGGAHVMLIGLDAPLAPGDRVPLVLTFERAGELAVEAPVVADPEVGS